MQTKQSNLFYWKSLYMFLLSQHPSSGVLKTVTTASSTGHNIGPIGPATSFQRGQVRTSPDLATFKGSRWTDIMTCTGGCSYSF